MMKSDEVRKIGFTGSTRVGKMLFAQAADTMKKVRPLLYRLNLAHMDSISCLAGMLA